MGSGTSLHGSVLKHTVTLLSVTNPTSNKVKVEEQPVTIIIHWSSYTSLPRPATTQRFAATFSPATCGSIKLTQSLMSK
eukprot:3680490-Ditylum_brightwellii.AAC.2